jgi:Right handed beta helix region
MRATSSLLAALATGAALAACGSAPQTSQAAPVRCDLYAHAGAGTAQDLADALKPGQTGCLRGGDYVGTGSNGYVLRPSRGGRRGRPIAIRSAPGERARLRGIIYVPAGSGRFVLSHTTIDARRPERPATGQVGIQVLADHVTLARNKITTQQAKTCLIITDGARRTTLRGNVFYDCGDPANGLFDHAVYAADTRRAQIVENVFVRASGWAVHLYPRAKHAYVARNLMWDNGGAVIFAGDEGSASSHNLVEDNVMGGSQERAELTSSFGGPLGRGNVARDNCLAPGLLASEGDGFVTTDNRVAAPEDCLDAAGMKLVDRLRGVAPALTARLVR